MDATSLERGLLRRGPVQDRASYDRGIHRGWGLRDLSKAARTFWAIVDANRAPEEAELADALDKLGWPDVLTLVDIMREVGSSSFADWLADRKNRRAIPHRFERCGYAPIRNDAAKDGLWVIRGTRQVVYARTELSVRDRFAAASARARK
jgi:hypothetical protein